MLLDNALARAGRLDILVNNAAVFHKHALTDANEARLRAEFGINLFVPVLLTRLFAQRVRAGGVINLLDRRIAANDPACLPYSLSKKALAAFTGEAALALAPGIVVNAVAPGAVLPPPRKGVEYLHDRAGRAPLGRRVRPRDVAAATVALLKLDGVTGQTIFVDGGQHLLGNGV
jgi:NAD(P)-dependent dehydrogenase (short-subunit alcohol dehydrogenase family)